MKIYLKIILKALFLSAVINLMFLFVFSFIINTGDIVGIIDGISIIFTMFLCTFLLIEEIRKAGKK